MDSGEAFGLAALHTLAVVWAGLGIGYALRTGQRACRLARLRQWRRDRALARRHQALVVQAIRPRRPLLGGDAYTPVSALSGLRVGESGLGRDADARIFALIKGGRS